MSIASKIKLAIKKKINPNKYSREAYINYLRGLGIKIGENTVFFSPETTNVDESRPELLTIGKSCKITPGVTIITHDFSHSVFRIKYGKILGEASETVIGDNVFIGMESMIMPGVKIGDNVIIGARSCVTKDIPSNSVAVGHPAKVIMTLDELFEKRKALQKEQAILLARKFYERHGRKPMAKEMSHFFPLFLERSRQALEESGVGINWSGDDREEIIESFLNDDSKIWENFDAFLKEVFEEE